MKVSQCSVLCLLFSTNYTPQASPHRTHQDYWHIQSLFVPHYYLKQIQALGMPMNLHSNNNKCPTILDITGTGTLPQI